MITHRHARAMAWVFAAGTFAAAVAAWWAALPSGSAQRRSIPSALGRSRPADTAGLAASAGLVWAANPFRTDRKPTKNRFTPWEPALVIAPPPGPPPAARPILTLIGLIGGPPWSAVVEGVPNQPGGVVLSQTDSGGLIKLIRVRGDTAFLSGLDTAWALTYRRP